LKITAKSQYSVRYSRDFDKKCSL